MKKLILLSFFLVAGIARADDACPQHHGPPPEAYDACTDKKSGDTCQVTLHEHTMDGTCAAAPDNRLACRPNHPPPGPPPDQGSP
ncbi:MAG TPA: hypothetical protein VHG72_01810 [Polyangia bacterium]|nr:hypothetical protein [Polyangia bacterium]